MKTPVICRKYSDGEIMLLFPEDTVEYRTIALVLNPGSDGVFYTHYEEVDYHVIIRQTKPLEPEAAKEPLVIAQRDELIHGAGRTLELRSRYKFSRYKFNY